MLKPHTRYSPSRLDVLGSAWLDSVSAYDGTVLLPDASIFLTGDFFREDNDLLIVLQTGEQVVVADYFSTDYPPVLIAANGAFLLPETVSFLLNGAEPQTLVAGPAMVQDKSGSSEAGKKSDTEGALTNKKIIGHVEDISSTITARSLNGKSRVLKRGDAVFEGEEIRAMEDGHVQLLFLDGTKFQLGSSGRLVLEKYLYNPEAAQGEFVVTVMKGPFGYTSGQLALLHPGRHSILKTPNAHIGIRGSELQGEVTDEGLTVIVHTSGVLDVADIYGLGTVTLLQTGTATIVITGEPPKEPFQAPENLLNRFSTQLPHKLPDDNRPENSGEEKNNQQESRNGGSHSGSDEKGASTQTDRNGKTGPEKHASSVESATSGEKSVTAQTVQEENHGPNITGAVDGQTDNSLVGLYKNFLEDSEYILLKDALAVAVASSAENVSLYAGSALGVGDYLANNTLIDSYKKIWEANNAALILSGQSSTGQQQSVDLTNFNFLTTIPPATITASANTSSSSSTSSQPIVNSSPSSQLMSGVFIDSAVAGVEFRTATQSGITGSDGSFFFMPGETVTFSIGNIFLGQVGGGSVVTPLDLASGDLPTTTNILRLLQTLDSDDNPANGITITSTTLANAYTLAANAVDLTVATAVFETNTSLTNFLTAESNTLISTSSAWSHFQTSYPAAAAFQPAALGVTVVFSSDTAPNGGTNADFITKTAAQTITGTLGASLAAGEMVYVSLDNGTTWNTATATAGQSTWTLPGQTLTASNTLRVVRVDAEGHDSPLLSQSYVLDLIAPDVTVSGIDILVDTGKNSNDFLTNRAAQTVTATLDRALMTGELLYGSLDGGVTWSNITSKTNGVAIVWDGATLAGSSSIKIKAVDLAGNDGVIASQSYVLDTTAPSITISALDIMTDTGSSAADFVTRVADQSIIGQLSANLASGDVLYGSVDSGVTWTDITDRVIGTDFSWNGVVLSGSNSILLKVTDDVGNDGVVASQPYRLDMVAPVVTVSAIDITADTGRDSNDFMTKTAAQTITASLSGALSSGEALFGSLDGGVTWTNITNQTSGTLVSWHATLLSGTHSIQVKLTDVAGNDGVIAGQAYTLDTTAPTATISGLDILVDTGSSATDFATNSVNQTVTGTLSILLESDERLYGSVNGGTSWTDITNQVNGTALSWSGVALSGSSSIQVKVTDAAGNEGVVADQAYVLDTTAPGTTIFSVAIQTDTGSDSTDFQTRTAYQTITGTLSAPLASGEILYGSVDDGTTWTNITGKSNGAFFSWNGTVLSGSSAIQIKVTDAVGNDGQVSRQGYVLDTTAPNTTIGTIDISQDTGSSAADFITNTANQTITAILSANLLSGEQVYGSADGGTTWHDITSKVTGTTVAWNGVVLTGSDFIQMKVVDVAGNDGTVASQAYTLDTVPSSITISGVAISNDTGSSATDFVTNVATQTISGTLSALLAAGETLYASLDAGANWTNISNKVNGVVITWDNATLAGDGSIQFKVTNTAGNEGAVAVQSYMLDQTAPVTSISSFALSTDTVENGGTDHDFITKIAAQTISGTLSANLNAGEVVSVSLDNGTTWLTAIAIPGESTWSLADQLLTGSDFLKIKVTDAAGNDGPIASQAYTWDTAGQTVVVTLSFSADLAANGSTNNDLNTQTALQTISGTVSANLTADETVYVSLDSGATWAAAMATAGQNTWSLANQTLTSSNTLQAKVFNSTTGTDSPVASRAYVLDTTAPTTTIASVAFSNDTAANGGRDTDFVTRTVAQNITGGLSNNLSVGETVYVSLDDGVTWSAATAGIGQNSWSLAGQTLSLSNTLKVKVTDLAGNDGAITSRAYALDSTAPTTTVTHVGFSADTAANNATNNDLNTKTAAQTLFGTLSTNLAAGEAVYVSLNNGSTWATATTTIGQNGWSLANQTLTASNILKVKVTDTAGNDGAIVSRGYVLDRVAPTNSIATVFFSADSAANGETNTDFNTRSATQTISGILSSNLATGETVQVSLDNGTTWSTATATVGQNTWSLPGQTLAGSDTLKVKLTDLAGNDGTVATQLYVLDTTAPTITITSMAFSSDSAANGTTNNDLNTNTVAQTISGTLSGNLAVGETVYVSLDDGTTWMAATAAAGQNRWSLAGQNLTVSNTLKAKVTDIAGNEGSVVSHAYILDRTAPATTVASIAFSSDTAANNTIDNDLTTKVTTQTISGTLSANLAVGEAVYVSLDNGLTWSAAAAATGQNTWSLANQTLTANNTLKVKVADTAGNDGLVAHRAYTLDVLAPTTTVAGIVFSADTAAHGRINADFNTKTAAQNISGILSSNLATDEKVYISLDNGSSWMAANTTVGQNNWSLDGQLLTASSTLLAKVTDTAGNDGRVLSQAFVLDTLSPTTTITSIAFSSDTAANNTTNTDFNTKTALQNITGTLSADLATGEAVYVSSDNGTTWIAAAATVGQNTWSLAGQILTSSSTLKVKVADLAGNDGVIASQAYVLDTVAPTTMIASLAFSSDTAANNTTNADFNTKATLQTISGTINSNLAVGESVYVSLDNGVTWAAAVTTVGQNSWSLADQVLTNSSTIKVKVTDLAGNNGITASRAYVLDTIAPTTTISGVALSADTAPNNNTNVDFITKTASQTIGGMLSNNLSIGETVYVSVDSGVHWEAATATVGQRNWVLGGQTLTVGHSIQMKVTDLAGNDGPTAGQGYVLDVVPPTTTIASVAFSDDTAANGTRNADFITKNAQQAIGGTLSADLMVGETVYVSLDDGITWSAAVSTAGQNTWFSWFLGNQTLTASHTLKMKVTDLAGNDGAIASQAYVLDTTAPTTTVSGIAFSADTAANNTTNNDFNTKTAAQSISGTLSTNLAVGETVYVSLDNGVSWVAGKYSVIPLSNHWHRHILKLRSIG